MNVIEIIATGFMIYCKKIDLKIKKIYYYNIMSQRYIYVLCRGIMKCNVNYKILYKMSGSNDKYILNNCEFSELIDIYLDFKTALFELKSLNDDYSEDDPKNETLRVEIFEVVIDEYSPIYAKLEFYH
jgi:hypothetical protein